MRALLIIDMLEDFLKQGVLLEKRAGLVKSINALVEQARNKEIPVIWVRQEFKKDLSDAFLVMKKNNILNTIEGTKGCHIIPELQPLDYENIIVKKRYSAFFKTKLDDYLKNKNIKELIITGVNTHACVRSTAVDAYQLDYEVVIPSDCVASYDNEHHEITLNYFKHGIATITESKNVFD